MGGSLQQRAGRSPRRPPGRREGAVPSAPPFPCPALSLPSSSAARVRLPALWRRARPPGPAPRVRVRCAGAAPGPPRSRARSGGRGPRASVWVRGAATAGGRQCRGRDGSAEARLSPARQSHCCRDSESLNLPLILRTSPGRGCLFAFACLGGDLTAVGGPAAVHRGGRKVE